MREMTVTMYLNFCHIPTLPVFCAGEDLRDAMGVDFFKMGDGWKKLVKGDFELEKSNRISNRRSSVMKKHLLIGLAFIALLSSMAGAQSEKLEAAPTKIVFGLSDGRISPPSPPRVLPEYEVLKSKVHHTKGQKFIVNRVVAPVWPPKRVPPPPTAEELEEAAKEMENVMANYKPSGGFFTVGVTVYDYQISQLRFQYEGEHYEVSSNINWGKFGHFLRFQGRGKEFTMMVFSGNVSTESLKKEVEYGYRTSMPIIPKLPALEKAGASYMILKGDEKNEAVMEFLEAVHDLYSDKKQVLTSTYQERLKNDIIRRKLDEELRKNPPPKKDVLINFWKRNVVKERRDAAARAERGKAEATPQDLNQKGISR